MANPVDRVSWLADTSLADWIDFRPPSWTRADTVATRVPSGYEAHARVLHPLLVAGQRGVRWADLAARAGRDLAASDHAVALILEVLHEPFGPWVYNGQSLGLTFEAWPDLAEILVEHTRSSSVIAGYADTWAYSLGPPGARWHGLRGYYLAELGIDQLRDPSVEQMPSILWPHDRAWFVHSDVEDFCTYVAGSRKLIQDVVACAQLEAHEVRPEEAL